MSLDKGNYYARIFFSDFSKGFDLVDHNVLLSDLYNLGINPYVIRWVTSFLTNRSQRVKINNSISAPISPNGGIPQGTKLTTLLFCILVNELVSTHQDRIKYVDDTTVVEFIPRCSPS